MARLIAVGTAVLVAVEPIKGSPISPSDAFLPRNIAVKGGIARRQCVAATPDVNQTVIISDTCSQNPQNGITTCASELTAYIQQSVAFSWAYYHHTFNDCLAANNNKKTECSDAELGYQNCSKYALQTYAYCGCYYDIPSAMYECANIELKVHLKTVDRGSIPTASLSTTAVLTGPAVPSSVAMLPSVGLSIIKLASLALASLPGAASSALPAVTGASTSVVPVSAGRLIATDPATPRTLMGPPNAAVLPIEMATATPIPPHFGAFSPGEGTRTEAISITTTSAPIVTRCASTFTSCPPAYASLSTYTTVLVTTLYYCGNTTTFCALPTTDGTPKATPLPTRGAPVSVVAVFSESGSSPLTISSLPDLGGSANEGLQSSRQFGVIVQTTVSGSVVTVYGPFPTGAGPGSSLNGIVEADIATATTSISRASLPEQTTLVRVPVETGHRKNGVCVSRTRGRSILMG